MLPCSLANDLPRKKGDYVAGNTFLVLTFPKPAISFSTPSSLMARFRL
jgi:hypothetical protein